MVRDQQKEFHELLEQYSIRSIRVSSQLKTFNNHMIAHKAEYLEHITRSLKTQKVFRASGAHEAQELIEMETGLLETLETQVSQL